MPTIHCIEAWLIHLLLFCNEKLIVYFESGVCYDVRCGKWHRTETYSQFDKKPLPPSDNGNGSNTKIIIEIDRNNITGKWERGSGSHSLYLTEIEWFFLHQFFSHWLFHISDCVCATCVFDFEAVFLETTKLPKDTRDAPNICLPVVSFLDDVNVRPRR